jgi:SAM-dependent methyltransferase
VPSGTFDYVISSHCLEHVPDTLRNLEEWLRVLKDDGCLFLVLPHRDRTFDRDRPISTLEHHLAEYGVEDDPDNPLHWDEWEHRLSRDQPPWLERPGARLADGRINPRFAVERGFIHYHCWTQDEMIRVLQYLGCAIDAALDRMPDRVDSFLIVARKGPREVRLDLLDRAATDDELSSIASGRA